MSKVNQTKILNDETLTSKLVVKGFWLYLFTIFIAPAGYLTRFMISYQFDPGSVGLFYSVISFILLISVYNDLGLTQAMAYFLPKYWIKKKYDEYVTTIAITFVVQLTTGVLFSLLLYFGFADWLAIHHFGDPAAGPIMRYFIWYFLGINLFQIINTAVSAFQDTFSQKIMDFARSWGVVVFTFIFFLLGSIDISHYVISWLAGLFIGLFISLVIYFKKYGWTLRLGKIVYKKKHMAEYLPYTLWTFLAMNSGRILGQVDQQMVVNMITTEAAGFYSNYIALYNTYTLPFTPLLMFMFPLVAELVVKNKHGKLTLLQNFMYTYLGLLALCFGAFIALWGPEISYIFLGEKFVYSGQLLSIGGWFVVTSVITSIGFNILAGLGMMKQRVWILVGSVVINIVMNYLLIPIFALPGVIFSTIIGQAFLCTASTYFVHKKNPIIVDRKFIIKNISLLTVLTVITYFVKSSLKLLSLGRLSLLFYLGLIGIIYCIPLGLINIKRVKELYKQVKYEFLK